MNSSSVPYCTCIARFPTKAQERLNDDVWVGRPHYVGKHILLYGKKSSSFPFQMMVGPDWQCMLLTYSLIIVPTVFFVVNVGYVLGWWLYLVGSFSGILTVAYFTLTACSDPGIVFAQPMAEEKFIKVSVEDIENGGSSPVETTMSSDLEPSASAEPSAAASVDGDSTRAAQPSAVSTALPMSLQKSASVNSASKFGSTQLIECGTCSLKRPTTASHCYDCGLCIDEIDHHCPWTGKCIAKRNLKNFYVFLWCLSIHIVFVLIVTIYCMLQSYEIFQFPK